MKRVAIETLGCKVNQADSSFLGGLLQRHDYRLVDFSEPADLVVINTCTVTNRADREARNAVRRARRKHPQAKIVLTGCYVQTNTKEASSLIEADWVIGNGEKWSLPKLLEEAGPRVQVKDIFKKRSLDEMDLYPDISHTRHFLKIQDGCNERCSYCIIPFARGHSRSLPVETIVSHMKSLVERGVREIVITGVHIGRYGRDLWPRTNFFSLLKRLEGELASYAEEGRLPRLRLSSFEPSELTEELIEHLVQSRFFCPHWHIPVQSADNKVLQAMRRHYTVEDFESIVWKIQKLSPEASIGTDLIVGFPGEGEEEFENGYSVLKKLPLSYFHVFPFSEREGTPAATFSDKVPAEQIQERASRLRALSDSKRESFYKSALGKSYSVIIEADKDPLWHKGFTENYIPVVLASQKLKQGKSYPVKLTSFNGATLSGVLV